MLMPGTKVEIRSGNFEVQLGYVTDWDMHSNMFYIVYHTGFRNWVHRYHIEVIEAAPVRTCDRCCNQI